MPGEAVRGRVTRVGHPRGGRARDSFSLYSGRTGMAVVLRALHTELGDTAAGAAADRALELVRSRFDGTRWGELFELMGGNAGIGLGALMAGDAAGPEDR
ncbi:lanthionine synthetase LanC family protein [Streptomyces sp. NPDC006285]|uniref:lanthionine synthetase LanC family protein n=1 Tax=Streptomyces sp. NPDC006285 TaxID=3364742 RepID=UPI003680EA3D